MKLILILITLCFGPEAYSQVIVRDKIKQYFKGEQALDTYKSFNDFIQCREKPVLSLNLDKQFHATTNQGDFGTCWSHAGTSLLSSAIYRVTKKHQIISPEFSAMQCATFENKAFKRYSELREQYIEASGTDMIDTIVDGGFSEEAVKWIIKTGEVCEDIPGAQSEMKKLGDENCQFLKAATEFEDIIVKSRGLGEVVCRTYGAQQFFTFNLNKFNQMRKKLAIKKVDLHEYKPFKLPAIAFKVSNEQTLEKYIKEKPSDLAAVCKMSDVKIQNQIRNFMRQLCQGRPIGISLYMNGVETSGNGGRSYRTYNGDKHARHAMIITGVEYDRDGFPFFVMRNSWKEGSKWNKHASKARMPVNEVCRIYREPEIIVHKDEDLSLNRTGLLILSEEKKEAPTYREMKLMPGQSLPIQAF